MKKLYLIFIALFGTLLANAQEFRVEYLTDHKETNSIAMLGDSLWAGAEPGMMKIDTANPSQMERIVDPFVDYDDYGCYSVKLTQKNRISCSFTTFLRFSPFRKMACSLF